MLCVIGQMDHRPLGGLIKIKSIRKLLLKMEYEYCECGKVTGWLVKAAPVGTRRHRSNTTGDGVGKQEVVTRKLVDGKQILERRSQSEEG